MQTTTETKTKTTSLTVTKVMTVLAIVASIGAVSAAGFGYFSAKKAQKTTPKVTREVSTEVSEKITFAELLEQQGNTYENNMKQQGLDLNIEDALGRVGQDFGHGFFPEVGGWDLDRIRDMIQEGICGTTSESGRMGAVRCSNGKCYGFIIEFSGTEDNEGNISTKFSIKVNPNPLEDDDSDDLPGDIDDTPDDDTTPTDDDDNDDGTSGDDDDSTNSEEIIEPEPPFSPDEFAAIAKEDILEGFLSGVLKNNKYLEIDYIITSYPGTSTQSISRNISTFDLEKGKVENFQIVEFDKVIK